MTAPPLLCWRSDSTATSCRSASSGSMAHASGSRSSRSGGAAGALQLLGLSRWPKALSERGGYPPMLARPGSSQLTLKSGGRHTDSEDDHVLRAGDLGGVARTSRVFNLRPLARAGRNYPATVALIAIEATISAFGQTDTGERYG